jgi:pimeloyl-ACP methyl ester carboxylesterase
MSSSAPATVVLVHGALHGAWCWDELVDALRRRGVPARAVDLPGHGGSPLPLGGLAGDVAALTATLSAVAGPVVLVGHSYGGAVVTATDAPRADVTHLVYVTASAPDDDHPAVRLPDGVAPRSLLEERFPGLGLRWVGDSGLIATADPAVALEALYDGCTEAQVRTAASRLGPHDFGSLFEAVGAAAWRRAPATYVVCTRDRILPLAAQRVLAARMPTVVELDSGHSPFLTHTAALADLLADRAKAG